ncbi:testis-expressed protein 19.2-like [Ursus americanus]|uniref:Testis expressed 19 n=1 Tax=Ursus americanus TaxID=9643 RepID=A0A452Q898_URSAM|nr:testis-expressed protein 19 [Ursus americanus]XP_045630974.1 testis-expressed protein 19.2-like [Ursus americanus]
MCPPVSVRHGAEGMSYLHASWMYQLQHGDQLGLCFTCFKTAFLELRDLLELEDWEDEDWDPELMDHAQAGPEQGGSPEMGLGWEQGPGHPAQGDTVDWGPGTLAAAPAGSEEVGLDHHFVPTELEPQNAAPLGLGPEDADWTQSLPWRLGGPPTCSHWPSLPPPWQGFLKVDLPPGEPMVLELGTTRAVDPAEAEAWLRDLQVISMVGCYDAIYLRKMTPGWARRTPGQGWKLLLEPDEVWVVRLQDAPQEQDLHRWKLSILESCPPGQTEELVPADSALLKRGFTILSYSPWAKREAEEGASASRPQSSSSRGQDPGTTEPWSLGPSGPSGPRGPGESPAAMGASALGELPSFQHFRPGPQN